MSSLEDKLSGILSDPDAVDKLKSLGAALGLDTGDQKPAVPPLNGTNINIPFLGTASNQNKPNDELMGTFMRLAPLLSDMNKDDEISRLLNSLRPFLSEHRRSRLDDAGKMLRVMRLLPLIKGAGFF